MKFISCSLSIQINGFEGKNTLKLDQEKTHFTPGFVLHADETRTEPDGTRTMPQRELMEYN